MTLQIETAVTLRIEIAMLDDWGTAPMLTTVSNEQLQQRQLDPTAVEAEDSWWLVTD